MSHQQSRENRTNNTVHNKTLEQQLQQQQLTADPKLWDPCFRKYLERICHSYGTLLFLLNAPDNVSESYKLSAANVLRDKLVCLINQLDRTTTTLFPNDKPDAKSCPDSCPGQHTPTPTPISLKPAVSEQSIMTDLTMTNIIDTTVSTAVFSDNSMALDLPASPTPRPTYASIVTSAQPPAESLPKPTTTSPQSRPKVQAPKAPVLNPVRLVVRPSQTSFKAKPFAMILINGPAEPFRRLTLALSLSPLTKDVKLLGVHVNRSQNLIVSLPHGTSETTVSNVITVIHSCFSTLVSFPLLITQDVAWTKFMVSSVPSRLNPGAPTYLEEEVQTSFLLNPAIQALSITRPPRWIRNPASITGTHSSFTFSFVDSDGSLGRSLAKSRLFTFGEPVHLKRWTDKPRQTRGANSK